MTVQLRPARSAIWGVAAAAIGLAPVAALAQASSFGNAPPRPAIAAPPAVPPAAGFGNTQPPSPATPAAPIAPPPAASATPPATVIAPAAPVPATRTAAAPTIVPPAAGPFAVEASATGFTVRNVILRAGPVAYQAPRVEIAGTALSRDEIARLLDPASDAPVAERVTRLAATSATIPELFSIVESGGSRQVVLYRDLVLSDLAGGRLASAVSPGGLFEGSGRDGAVTGSYGRMELRGLDLGLGVALMTEASAPDAANPMRTLYGSLAIEGLRFAAQDGGTATIARLVGRDVAGRRTRDGWAATLRRLSAVPATEPADPAERAGNVAAMLDLLDAYEIGEIEATGLAFSGPAGKDGAVRIARLGYRGGAGRPGEIALDGIDAGGDGNRVALSSLSVGGIAVGPALEAARRLVGREPGTLTAAEMRSLVPGLGSIRATGLEIATQASGRPQRIALGSFELAGDRPVDGLPSDVRLAVRDATIPVDATGGDPGMQQLAGLGYDRVVGSLAASLAYDEAGSAIVLRELSARAADMGSVTVRALLGNVSRDLFDPDQAVAAVAAVAATIRSLDVVVENAGLFERVVAREAKNQGRSPADIRRDYGLAAAIGVPVMLGNSAAAKTLGQALGRFVAKPGRLAIQVRTKSPAGLGFADFAASPDPTTLLDQVEITATSE